MIIENKINEIKKARKAIEDSRSRYYGKVSELDSLREENFSWNRIFTGWGSNGSDDSDSGCFIVALLFPFLFILFLVDNLLILPISKITYPKRLHRAEEALRRVEEELKVICTSVESCWATIEGEAEKLQDKFISSVPAKEMAVKMSEVFLIAINGAPRNAYQEDVYAGISIYVEEKRAYCYSDNKTSSYYGEKHATFDYIKWGYEDLTELDDRVGLAFALRTLVWNEVLKKINKDISGTDYTLESEFKHIYECFDGGTVRITITYRAKNGNYKVIRKW